MADMQMRISTAGGSPLFVFAQGGEPIVPMPGRDLRAPDEAANFYP
jgi:hypothetical protein